MNFSKFPSVYLVDFLYGKGIENLYGIRKDFFFKSPYSFLQENLCDIDVSKTINKLTYYLISTLHTFCNCFYPL